LDSVDLEVLQNSVAWLRDGHAVTLVTVTRTWGSGPRPQGAMMAVRDDGLVWGSVAGGSIEDDLVERARKRLPSATLPERASYAISGDAAQRFGLTCGGTIEVMLEPVTAGSRLPELLEQVQARRRVARELDLATGEVQLRTARDGESLQCDDRRLVTIHGPRYRLLIIGAVQISKFLAQIARALDYQVTVCDPRAEYSRKWDLAGVELLVASPDEAVIRMRPDLSTAIVALTHDPALDDLGLLEALKSPAFYVGALGSRANDARRRERLRRLDLTQSQLERLVGPIGLPIGSRTPSEIAVSIAAQLTACKYGVSTAPSALATAAIADRGCTMR